VGWKNAVSGQVSGKLTRSGGPGRWQCAFGASTPECVMCDPDGIVGRGLLAAFLWMCDCDCVLVTTKNR
jgi:hypothetical protein